LPASRLGANNYRSILDLSPGETRVQIDYKTRRSGGSLYWVTPAYTSQRCSACGHTQAQNRPTRDDFKCLSCGHAACADDNAAHNILYLGRKARAEDIRSWPVNRASLEVASRKKTVAVPAQMRRDQDPKLRPKGRREVTWRSRSPTGVAAVDVDNGARHEAGTF
jgi:hypothetical protein